MFAYGFGMGTFKYLFAHWILVMTYRGMQNYDYSFFDIFLPTYLGAVVAMSVFYWGSEYFMKRAADKRHQASIIALKSGTTLKTKKKVY